MVHSLCLLFCSNTGIEPIAEQYAGGILLSPVQKPGSTLIFAPCEQKCKSIPVADMIGTGVALFAPNDENGSNLNCLAALIKDRNSDLE